jgi:hypothetical protein
MLGRCVKKQIPIRRRMPISSIPVRNFFAAGEVLSPDGDEVFDPVVREVCCAGMWELLYIMVVKIKVEK